MNRHLSCGLMIWTAPTPDGRVLWSVDNTGVPLSRGYAASQADADQAAARAAKRILASSIAELAVDP